MTVALEQSEADEVEAVVERFGGVRRGAVVGDLRIELLLAQRAWQGAPDRGSCRRDSPSRATGPAAYHSVQRRRRARHHGSRRGAAMPSSLRLRIGRSRSASWR